MYGSAQQHCRSSGAKGRVYAFRDPACAAMGRGPWSLHGDSATSELNAVGVGEAHAQQGAIRIEAAHSAGMNVGTTWRLFFL